MDTNYNTSHANGLSKSKKQQLHVVGHSYEEHLVEVAQQKCFLPDHVTRPSAAQARIMLQNGEIRMYCALALSYHDSGAVL